MSGDTIEVEGVVVKTHKGDFYEVAANVGGRELRVRARRCGRMMKHRIRVLDGDRVKIEISAYDVTKGRIVHREDAATSGGEGDAEA